ncbi:chemotaxis response regulator protein-glutamate methylesterase [Sporosarcina sp. HYO08]|uniref:protein-glutamate methylesterase/protein-glutamine glutaminase n=1 Tax=Sporosarcina sp. HYO08 TaxID=1759557 RepID=UPI00079BABEB|nr:chemotaxis response regulator protein-glutamate methylesterase [Sporosarcina sp. HYO08]KXH80000.1 chemotaxis response regulator protein-glutamate methylesterase [Sporosarcina sp. HYO08]
MNALIRKKVLIVDDSAFMRKLLTDFLTGHPSLEVIGVARNGKEAVEKVKALKPDVVTMDIEMPVMNGLDAVREIMAHTPVPIVMLSSTTTDGAENTMLALEYGAVDFIAKPGGAISLNLHDVKDEIIQKVLAALQVQRTSLTRKKDILKKDFNSVTPAFYNVGKTVILIGTSTGGPRALQEALKKLPATIQAPILVVQHMPAGFTKSLANRLNGLCDIHVKEAEDGELLVNGTAYIAPGNYHLSIKKVGTSYCVNLDNERSPRMGHRPSVDVLFESAAQYENLNVAAVVMTGMGQDGMRGLKLLKKSVKTVSIAESESSSVVFGMPKAVIEAGLADMVADVQDIPKYLIDLIKS